MTEATIRAQVELQYALDRMSTPLHASRLSDATAAEDARCMAIIRAEIDRLTRERDELADEVALKIACINGMSQTVDKLAAERDALARALRICVWALRQPIDGWKGECERRALDAARGLVDAQIEQERSEQAKDAEAR